MTWLDGAALGFFLVGWWLLGWLIDSSPWHRHTLSAAMKTQRREWMRQMAAREIRLVDANIITGLQQATSFFASTALLAVGAGFGLLTAADTIIGAFEQSFVHRADRPRDLLREDRRADGPLCLRLLQVRLGLSPVQLFRRDARRDARSRKARRGRGGRRRSPR